MKKIKKSRLRINEVKASTNVALNIFFLIFAFLCIYPLALVIGTSFAEESYLLKYGYKVFPEVVSLDAYKYILENSSVIVRAYLVTIYTTVVGVVVSVIMMTMAAYALSREEFKYRKIVNFIMFFTMLFSGGLVPWYLLCTQILHIQDTYAALIWPALLNVWYIFILRTFIKTNVPSAVIESARLDGANEMLTLFKIVLPISLPGIATIALFTTLNYWNNWYNAFMLTSDAKYQNIQLFLKKMINNADALLKMGVAQSGEELANLPSESARMAIVTLVIGPMLLAYPFFQRFFVKGMTVGSVKG